MSEYDRSYQDQYRRSRDDFERWGNSEDQGNAHRRQSDYLHSDYRNRANMSSRGPREDRDNYREGSIRHNDRAQDDHDRNFWTRSVDEVRSWFGDDEAERRRIRDEEERMRQDQIGAYHNHAYMNDRDDRRRYDERSRSGYRANEDRGWDSSRGYGSNMDRDYGRNSARPGAGYRNNDRSDASYFRSSNEYGGSRNRDYYRDYPTHNTGRSWQNNEDDEIKHGYESQFDYHQSNALNDQRMFGGREYERNYPTRAERQSQMHDHDYSEGWQSNDSQRGYRSLNNTGRTGIGQDNQLGRERSPEPNYEDRNFSRGDYSANLNAGGQEYNSRHYEQSGRMGSPINEHAQRGYAQGYGRTGYSLNQAGNYANAETSARHPKNYKGTDDRIYVEVCEALGRELDASDIEVKAFGNEITLNGSVTSREDKRRAERIAEGVRGVEDVHNQLTVKEATSSTTSQNATSSTSNSTSSDRPASQQGNSTRTDLAADGSSKTEERSTTSSSGDPGRSSTSSNGSGRGSARK